MESRALDISIVVRIVREVCDHHSHRCADDLASNVITSIWAKQTEFTGERHLRAYVRKSLRGHLLSASRAAARVRLFSESLGEDQSETAWLDTVASSAPMQETLLEADRLKRIAEDWPFVHKRLVFILAEGASILEAAQELGLPPWDAIRLLREARRFVETGSSVIDRGMAA